MRGDSRAAVDYRRLARRNLASLLRYKFLHEYGYDKGAVVVAAIVADICETIRRYYARPGITYRPVTGVSPSQAGVAWPPANDTNPVVQDFVRCCLDNKPPPDFERHLS